MDALFRGLVSQLPFAAKSEPQPATQSPVLIPSPRSYHMPAYPMAREWDERQQRAAHGSSATSATEGRIAHWDKKREKCQNCKHIYLKTLSRHPGFCSVDCKSNAAYIDKVNRTIKAVRSAVEQLQQDKAEEEEHDATTTTKTETIEPESADRIAIRVPLGDARSFAEFGLEERLPTDQNVEWAFSAIY